MSELTNVDELFSEHDERALASLSEADLAAQIDAREAIWLHVDGIWHRAVAEGVNPAVEPGWSAVALVRELTAAMFQRARAAASADGED